MPSALAQLVEERVDETSLRAVAQEAKIGKATVRRIIDGGNPSTGTLSRLSDYLGLPAGEVFRLAGIDANENEGDDLLNALILMLLAKLPPDVKRQAMEILRVLAGE